jgi:hypothetical protein
VVGSKYRSLLEVYRPNDEKWCMMVMNQHPELIELCCDHVLTISNGKVFSLLDKTGAV